MCGWVGGWGGSEGEGGYVRPSGSNAALGVTDLNAELRSCVEAEVAVLGYRYLIVPTVSVDVQQH